MNYKFRTGNIVRVKRTGEKATIREIVGFTHVPAYWIDTDKQQGVYVFETEVKPYCPTRSGTRDPKTGRFVSKRKGFGCTYCQECFWSDKELHEHIEEHFNPDSKHRNYQKITKLNDSIHNYVSTTVLIETMLFKINEIIDELGRRV